MSNCKGDMTPVRIKSLKAYMLLVKSWGFVKSQEFQIYLKKKKKKIFFYHIDKIEFEILEQCPMRKVSQVV